MSKNYNNNKPKPIYYWSSINKCDKYVNPYNFVPFSKIGVERKVVNEEKEKYTGKLMCSLITKTPTIIVGPSLSASEDGKNTHKEFNCFSYGNYQAVIPASEIRGVVRNIYETITNSCLAEFDDDMSIIYRQKDWRNDGVDIFPGVLRYDGKQWSFYKGKSYAVENINELKNYYEAYKNYKTDNNFNKVYYKESENDNGYNYCELTSDNKDEVGYIILNGRTPKIDEKDKKHNKRCQVIGNIDENQYTDTRIDNFSNELQKAVIKLKDILKKYAEQAKKLDDHRGYACYGLEDSDSLNVNKSYPIFLTIQNNKMYLCPAKRGKVAAFKTLGEYAKKYLQCQDANNLCAACSLFGTLNQGKLAVSSKVFFSDAYPQNQNANILLDSVVLPELSSPKISCAEFYTHINNSPLRSWTYDSNGVQLNGRKFYWHHEVFKEKYDSTDNNATVRPIEKDIEFKFEVIFKDVTKDEIKNLITSINLGSNDNNNYQKIGMAKPIGYGSCKMKVNEVLYRFPVDDEYQLSENKLSDYEDVDLSKKWPELAIITDFNSLSGSIVSYPKSKNPKGEDIGYNFMVFYREMVQSFKKNGNKFVDEIPTIPTILQTKPDTKPETKIKIKLPTIEKYIKK